MRVLVVGGGAREHALVWRLKGSPGLHELIAAPGNAGIADLVTCYPVAVDDVPGLTALAVAQRIDFVVVGPEAPLTLGLVDALAARGIAAFGPTAAAAQLEGSKAFTKALAKERGIPTADFATFTDREAARAHICRRGAPIVVKADGLAAGKGVVVAESVDEALAAIDRLLAPGLGARVVIEECLFGEEVSFFALCDGRTALALGAAQDHKRAFDGDKGPNTGGMGAYGPPPIFTPALEARVMDEIIRPTLAAMNDAGTPFRGVLFAGLMITPRGDPKLIEFNTRFGDPEAQVLMMRLGGDLLPVLLAAARGDLGGVTLSARPEPALTVVYAAKGYPDAPQTGTVIGLPADLPEGVQIFHGGTGRDESGRLVAKGGRVLSITAQAATLEAARDTAYAVIAAIDWPSGFYRRDIGHRATSG